MPKVSIIVPVYNVAEYLRRSLDSCIYQTLADIEVIAVNDCSPDERDEEILREYERENPEKIHIFRHEKNLGLGEARNTAIRNAKGEFLLFVTAMISLTLPHVKKCTIAPSEMTQI